MKSWWSLESIFLQEMRRCEKRSLDFYVDTEKKAVSARRIQRDKEMEERGGSSESKMKRIKYAPPPECRRFRLFDVINYDLESVINAITSIIIRLLLFSDVL
jgi:hypothetical protein